MGSTRLRLSGDELDSVLVAVATREAHWRSARYHGSRAVSSISHSRSMAQPCCGRATDYDDSAAQCRPSSLCLDPWLETLPEAVFGGPSSAVYLAANPERVAEHREIRRDGHSRPLSHRKRTHHRTFRHL